MTDLTDRTILQLWLDRVRAHPDAPAVHTESAGWRSHQQLAEDSGRIAARFRELGLQPGDRIMVSCAASYALVATHVGALRAGLVVVPTNTAYQEPELRHIATDAEISAAVLDSAERATWLEIALTPEQLLASDPQPSPDPPVRPEDTAIIAYTSGTTGAPKGARLSHRNVAASARSVAQEWGWTESDRLILCLPLFHMHGLGVGLHGTLVTGGSALLQERFDAEQVLAATAEGTMFFGVPTMYERLRQHPRVAELGRLRLCVSGSAPLPADTWRDLAAKSGQEVLERYGMTETIMLVSNPGEGERRPGTVGLPLPGVEVRLAESREGVGQIEVRGPSVFDGYWRNPAGTAEAFTDDGWFRTGDLGEHDERGYLRIVGRSKELIISGGYNVYPREVEDALRAHPGVADVAVVGLPSAEWGETVTAFVVPAGVGAGIGAGADELSTFLADKLAAYKRPRRWVSLESLPRNALGKVLKPQLQRDHAD